MANNTLTPEQDVLTRRFYLEVAQDDSLFPSNPALARQLRAIIINQILGYVVVGGAFVSPDKLEKRNYFSQGEALEDEWGPDYERAIAALEGTSEATEDDTGTDEADSSESTEGSEVR